MRYFVSGHRDLTMEEFDRHYVYQLDRVLADDPYAEFVVGDWEGCDTIFVKYMEEYYTDVRIHIFYVFSFFWILYFAKLLNKVDLATLFC